MIVVVMVLVAVIMIVVVMMCRADVRASCTPAGTLASSYASSLAGSMACALAPACTTTSSEPEATAFAITWHETFFMTAMYCGRSACWASFGTTGAKCHCPCMAAIGTFKCSFPCVHHYSPFVS